MEILTLQPNQEDAGTRIDAWLAANLEDVTRSGAQRVLEEGNTWHDTFWGVDARTREGRNHLGRILMRIRKELQGSFEKEK